MSLILDIIVGFCALFVIIWGVKKGFVKAIMQLGSSVAAFLAAMAFYNPVSQYIYENFLKNAISGEIESTVRSMVFSDDGLFNLEKLFEDKPDAFLQIINRYNSDLNALEAEYGSQSEAASGVITELSESISNPVAHLLSNILAFAGVFLAALLVLTILMWILDLIFKLPVLSAVNKIFGFFFGIVSAAVLVCVVSFILITLIEAMTPIYPEIFNSGVIDSSYILNFFKENNVSGMIQNIVWHTIG